MGIKDKVGGSLKGAIATGQKSVEKYTSRMIEQNEAIIERLNWVMVSNQAICDHLKIKLKDPLEVDEEEDKGGKK